MSDAAIRDLVLLYPRDRIFLHEPMKNHTSLRVGGPADALALPESAGEIAQTLRICGERGVRCLVMGNGTNLLVRDGGFRGVVLKLSDRFTDIRVSGPLITAQAGALLSAAAAAAQRAALTGLEFASGIPGSVGGASAMNAGAYGGAMSDAVARVQALDARGDIRWIEASDLGFSYRRSLIPDKGLTVLAVEMRLAPGDDSAIAARVTELALERRRKQPLDLPSAGSAFKRPPGAFAAQLIEEAGLKGARSGDAQVSPKHAGFIVNLGNAAAADILALMDRIAQTVEARAGVRLEPEVRVVGEDPPCC